MEPRSALMHRAVPAEGPSITGRPSVAWHVVHPLRSLLLALAGRSFGAVPDSRGAPSVRAHLDLIVEAFLDGYRAGAMATDAPALSTVLDRVEPDRRGFAYEGAAMAVALSDALAPGPARRLRTFIRGPAAPHVYMAHVGVGWAMARLPLVARRIWQALDPVLAWLAIDGYGFHEGYFSPARVVRSQLVPGRLRGYSVRAFDQGLGRALWFVECADVDRIARTVHAFPPARRAELWSGVALAATYAGGVDLDQVCALKTHAGSYAAHVAQGGAFAAEARIRAGCLTPHTAAACLALTGVAPQEASTLVRRLRRGIADAPGVPSYEQWRRRTAAALRPER